MQSNAMLKRGHPGDEDAANNVLHLSFSKHKHPTNQQSKCNLPRSGTHRPHIFVATLPSNKPNEPDEPSLSPVGLQRTPSAARFSISAQRMGCHFRCKWITIKNCVRGREARGVENHHAINERDICTIHDASTKQKTPWTSKEKVQKAIRTGALPWR